MTINRCAMNDTTCYALSEANAPSVPPSDASSPSESFFSKIRSKTGYLLTPVIGFVMHRAVDLPVTVAAPEIVTKIVSNGIVQGGLIVAGAITTGAAFGSFILGPGSVSVNKRPPALDFRLDNLRRRLSAEENRRMDEYMFMFPEDRRLKNVLEIRNPDNQLEMARILLRQETDMARLRWEAERHFRAMVENGEKPDSLNSDLVRLAYMYGLSPQDVFGHSEKETLPTQSVRRWNETIEIEFPVQVPIDPGDPEELPLVAMLELSRSNARMSLSAERRSEAQIRRGVLATLIVARAGTEIGRRDFPLGLALDGSRPVFVQEYWDDFFSSLGLPPDTDLRTLQLRWEFKPLKLQGETTKSAPIRATDSLQLTGGGEDDARQPRPFEAKGYVTVPFSLPTELSLTARVVEQGGNVRVQLSMRESLSFKTINVTVIVTNDGTEVKRGDFEFTPSLPGSGFRSGLGNVYFWDGFLKSLGLPPDTDLDKLRIRWEINP